MISAIPACNNATFFHAGDSDVYISRTRSEEEKKLLETGHSFMEIDTRYSSFKTVRKDEGMCTYSGVCSISISAYSGHT